MLSGVTQLVITGEPAATITAGTALELTVTAEDVNGVVVPGYTNSVSLTLATRPLVAQA